MLRVSKTWRDAPKENAFRLGENSPCKGRNKFQKNLAFDENIYELFEYREDISAFARQPQTGNSAHR